MSLLLAGLLLSACGGGGGGGSGGSPPSGPLPTQAEAFRFLQQATFGPRPDDLQRLMRVGYDRWLDEQLGKPATLQLTYLQGLNLPQYTQNDRLAAWWRHAITADDQLRQRVAFALSEIFVVSEIGALFDQPLGLANYYDLLARDAFGNFRTLMEDVTLSPAMGVYLSMLGNQRANPAFNIRPDENYARELMQLFTIGLVELNLDGSVKVDSQGQPLPTYDQSVIEGFARVYTGWTFGNSPGFYQPSFDYLVPMQSFAALHEPGAKTLLRGTVIPAGQTPAQDLDAALDNIFNHPNVGPFIARRLIERLTASNPSAQYVQRIATVFNDNGRGVRGDLGAVVRAILLDSEARAAPTETSGKLKEPLLRITQVWRAFDARSASGRYALPDIDYLIGQAPQRSPSVFNFFRPGYAPPGELRDRGLVAPEMEITTEATATGITNALLVLTYLRTSASVGLPPDDVFIDITDEQAIGADTNALVNQIADKLLGGQISSALRAEVVAQVDRIPSTPATLNAYRASEAIFAIASSPEFAVAR